MVVTAGCHHSKSKGRQQDRREKRLNKENESGGGRRVRAGGRGVREMERKRGKWFQEKQRRITDRCKVTP